MENYTTRKVLGFEIPEAHINLLRKSGFCDRFDPYDFVESRVVLEDGNERVYLTLPVRAQALWFRSVYPDGRIEPVYKGMESGVSYIVEVHLYKNDRPDTIPFASGIAVTSPAEKKPEGETQIGYANAIASAMAFTNAGFNIPTLFMALADVKRENTTSEEVKEEQPVKKKKARKDEIVREEVAAPAIESLATPTPLAVTEVTEVPTSEPIVIVPEAATQDEPVEVKPVVVEKPMPKVTATPVVEPDYAQYDRELWNCEIDSLARILITEGGQGLPAGRHALSPNSGLVKWLTSFACDDTAPVCRRAQGKILEFLVKKCAEDPAALAIVKTAIGA